MEELVAKAQKGDKKAVEELYRMNHSFVYSYILRRVKNTYDAEELTSKVFLRMIERLHQYENLKTSGGFPNWLSRIAHNIVVDEWRRKKTVVIETGSGWEDESVTTWRGIQETDDSAEDYAFIEIDRQDFKRFLDYCTQQQADVIRLKYMEDYTNEMIATELGLSVGAVKSMQHRAFDNIRTGLEADMAVL